MQHTGISVSYTHLDVYKRQGAGDLACIQKLLKNMEHIPPEQRTAKFVCAICCIYPDGKKIEVQGECPGHIAFEMHGDNGFGYDPVFLVGERPLQSWTARPRIKLAIAAMRCAFW